MRTGPPFCLRVQISASPVLREEIIKIACTQLGPIQARPECLDICFLQDIKSPEVFIWEEAWSCQEKLRERVASEEFRAVLTLVDMSTDLPKITVSELVNVQGMQWIAKERGLLFA